MKYFTTIALMTLIVLLSGCAFTPAFHNSAETELKILSESLENTKLEDLFRQYPTLRLVKSTEIGNGNMRHEFSYDITEKEDGSQRRPGTYTIYLYERHITFSINIFVDASGIIYEVLQPVPTNVEIIMTNEPYSKFKKPNTKEQLPIPTK